MRDGLRPFAQRRRVNPHSALGGRVLELDAKADGIDVGGMRLISGSEAPDDLEEIHRQIVESGADIAKLAVLANDIHDNLRMFDLLQKAGIPTIGLCMGEEGAISRILGPRFGSFLSFGTLAEGKESAPGQIAIEDMRDLYRIDEINSDTKLYGVIANPVAHSMSPAIHNAAFQAKGINAVYLLWARGGSLGRGRVLMSAMCIRLITAASVRLRLRKGRTLVWSGTLPVMQD
jgi:hypothetical protein